MANSILSKKIPKSCDYCFYGRKSSAFDVILCKYKGPVDIQNHCRKFEYDPLKREPKFTTNIPKFKSEDFEL